MIVHREKKYEFSSCTRSASSPPEGMWQEAQRHRWVEPSLARRKDISTTRSYSVSCRDEFVEGSVIVKSKP